MRQTKAKLIDHITFLDEMSEAQNTEIKRLRELVADLGQAMSNAEDALKDSVKDNEILKTKIGDLSLQVLKLGCV